MSICQVLAECNCKPYIAHNDISGLRCAKLKRCDCKKLDTSAVFEEETFEDEENQSVLIILLAHAFSYVRNSKTLH